MLALVTLAVTSSSRSIIATTAVFNATSGHPSKSNYIGRVNVATDKKTGVTFCAAEHLAPMHDSINCSVSTVDRGSNLVYSVCRTELSPRPPCFLEVRSATDGSLMYRVPVKGEAAEGKSWDLAVFVADSGHDGSSSHLLLYSIFGGVVRVDPVTGDSVSRLLMPTNLSASWLMPTAAYDAASQVFSVIIAPRSKESLRSTTDAPTPRLATAAANARAALAHLPIQEERLAPAYLPKSQGLADPAAPSAYSLLSLSLASNQSWVTPLTGDEALLERGIFNTVYTAKGTLMGLAQTGADPRNTSSVLVRINSSSGVVMELPATKGVALIGTPPLIPLEYDSAADLAVLRMDSPPDMNDPSLKPTFNPRLYLINGTTGTIKTDCTLPLSLSYGAAFLAV